MVRGVRGGGRGESKEGERRGQGQRGNKRRRRRGGREGFQCRVSLQRLPLSGAITPPGEQ